MRRADRPQVLGDLPVTRQPLQDQRRRPATYAATANSDAAHGVVQHGALVGDCGCLGPLLPEEPGVIAPHGHRADEMLHQQSQQDSADACRQGARRLVA